MWDGAGEPKCRQLMARRQRFDRKYVFIVRLGKGNADLGKPWLVAETLRTGSSKPVKEQSRTLQSVGLSNKAESKLLFVSTR